MPGSPGKPPAPPAPHCEDYDDSADEKAAVPPPAANIAKKVTRRDEASDSGYSSHTFATGSSSQGSKKKSSDRGGGGGILRVFGMGKKSTSSADKAPSQDKSQAKASSPKTLRRPSISRARKKEDLRASAHQGKDAAKKRPDLSPIETKGIRVEQLSKSAQPVTTTPVARRPIATAAAPVANTAPPQLVTVAKPEPRPKLYATAARQRPYSYHGGAAPIYAPPQIYYAQAYATPAPVVMPGSVPSYQIATAQYYWPPRGPTSPNRVINYSLPPTVPPQYLSQQQYWHDGRRLSMSAAPVEYPRVPPAHTVDPAWIAPHGQQPISAADYSPESPEDYDAVMLEDGEAYYRSANVRDAKRREKDRRSMPPPPLPPQRPGLGRSATVSTSQPTAVRRSQRQSLEIPTKSSRRTSMDEGRNRSPTRPQTVTRTTHSSHGSGRDAPATDQPPPTLRRRSGIISRPTSYQEPPEARQYKEAEAYQAAQTGDSTPQTLTTDDVQKVLRQKSEPKRSTKSHSSRTSSKSSDPRKSRKQPSERLREKKPEPVTVKIGKAIFDPRGRSFNVRQTEDNVEIRVRPETKSREERPKYRERSVRYVAAGSSHGRGPEVEVARTHTRSRSRRRSTVESTSGTVGDYDHNDAPRRAESRSRRSSRSTTGSRRPVVRIGEGEYF